MPITPTVKDTAYSVSPSDVNSVNHMKADLDACNELADSLDSRLQNYESLKLQDDATIKKFQDDNKNLESQVNQLGILNSSYKAGESKEKRKNRFAKGFATGFGIIAIIEAGYIAISKVFRQ